MCEGMPLMKLIPVNVSLPREAPHGNATVTTGIFKEPVQSRVRLRVTNLEEDDPSAKGAPPSAPPSP